MAVNAAAPALGVDEWAVSVVEAAKAPALGAAVREAGMGAIRRLKKATRKRRKVRGASGDDTAPAACAVRGVCPWCVAAKKSPEARASGLNPPIEGVEETNGAAGKPTACLAVYRKARAFAKCLLLCNTTCRVFAAVFPVRGGWRVESATLAFPFARIFHEAKDGMHSQLDRRGGYALRDGFRGRDGLWPRHRDGWRAR